MDITTTYLGLTLDSPLIAGSSGLTGSVKKIKSMCEQHNAPLFQMTGIKVFVDGVVEGATAFLLNPYDEHAVTEV